VLLLLQQPEAAARLHDVLSRNRILLINRKKMIPAQDMMHPGIAAAGGEGHEPDPWTVAEV